MGELRMMLIKRYLHHQYHEILCEIKFQVDRSFYILIHVHSLFMIKSPFGFVHPPCVACFLPGIIPTCLVNLANRDAKSVSVAWPSCRRKTTVCCSRVLIWEWLRLVKNLWPHLTWGSIEFPNRSKSEINVLCSKSSEFLCKWGNWHQRRMATSREQWMDLFEMMP